MAHGLVVRDFDDSYTHCIYCGTKMIWGERSNGNSSFTNKSLPTTKTFGCPRYGNDVAGPLGWHDFWWEDNLYDILYEDRKNANI